ncbi:MAG: DEAD/DEAH box helicase [Rhabdochlamydiaceae bacterium]|nr:DEAD/DEAH box helicase [Candidatus Amphrikana amoebophyrae]
MKPSFLRTSDLEKGRTLLHHANGIRALFFSERTYQIQVSKDEKSSESYWVFLGLDQSNIPTDFFCECDDFEKHQSCSHIAAAYLSIFTEHEEPLHVRYKSSLWYILFFIAARRHGFSPNISKLSNKYGFEIESTNKKVLFSMEALSEEGEEKLNELVFNRVKETEENSIKFSNLSMEELKLYKEGNPSINLQFELSFWSDLSKWLMFLDSNNESHTIEFKEEKNDLPSEVRIQFVDVEFTLYIAKANWQEILMFLKNVDSNLPVFDFSTFELKEIKYDESIHAMLLTKEEFEFPSDGNEIEVSNWIYRPDFGFFPIENDPLFESDIIERNSIRVLFRRYLELVKRKLKNRAISFEDVEPKYDLKMTKQGELHIKLYAFKKGDLDLKSSFFFHPWAYISGHGFFKFTELMFDTDNKVITKENLAEFISHYRAWLSNYDGFHTHLSSMESKLEYEVRMDKTLIFHTTEDFGSESEGVVDLGEWLYIKDQGFFSKNMSGVHSFLKAGMELKQADVSGFIRSHEPELELVQGFFSTTCPVAKMGLKVYINAGGVIEVDPLIHYTIGYEDKKVVIFDEYAFVQGEGFSRIPESSLLPSGYEKHKEIPAFLEQHFLFQELDDLKPYIVYLDKQLTAVDELTLSIDSVKCNTKTGHWSFDLKYTSELGEVRFEELFNAVTTLKPFVASDAGLIIIKEPRFDWMKGIDEKHLSHEGVKLSTMEWVRACVYENVEFTSECDPELVKQLEQFNNPRLDSLEKPNLTGFKSDLRPYQELGVKWLWHLYLNHLSGILADEMGLGKTHQAMGIIASVMNHNRLDNVKFFVVCPTSVVYHWEALLAKFLPEAKVRLYYGTSRKLEVYDDCDIFLTSYGTLRTDIVKIKKLPFEVAIFDEMQSAKNKHSQIHKSLKALKSKMKLGLTGTPIENDIFELKALFDILLPQFFPSDEKFKAMFFTPPEQVHDSSRTMLLNKLINPFILRRKKSEVLQDLPEKIEEIAHIEMSEEQRKIYNDIFTKGFAEIEDLENNQESQLSLHVFALINKLKQVCDHPAVLTKSPHTYTEHVSGKFELFKELLREARESGQKVVVFTQYLDMMRIMSLYLESMDIGYATIHGGTRNRKGEVERFRDNPECEVFIASLQAGGVGIDLISASVVIHYDRWWNAAKENQATDRVHRYGQTRGVQVFKMVSKHTIEEHIHQMIEKKKGLMQSVVGYDDESQFKKIDPKELMNLLRDVHKNMTQ